MTSSSGGFTANAASINGSSHLLVELAGLLYAGRPDGELTVMARVPRSHQEVSTALDSFARFGNDQYLDTVSLLAALATKLKVAGGDYAQTDQATEGTFRSVLDNGRFIPAGDR
ncbi:hypothetical protein NRK68_26495 [Streptomyces yangpuensis]|uniref:Uncharacterized protein n=1 Tax=Streptomyces yangpuensis TaxID=1648182 RepID=A0ABY5Q2A5_9ACTN|nr:hypothetical protein [Streptomyces yangpuensis]MBZ9598681.1 hypothetical protein [Streptomyces erythrochromogenes]UUY50459.1 hypothetical protein NRK68_26495 [Streptomyces yangpuensis]